MHLRNFSDNVPRDKLDDCFNIWKESLCTDWDVLSIIGVVTRQKKVKAGDSGEVASGRCVIMSLVDGGTEKARATCRERERRVWYA